MALASFRAPIPTLDPQRKHFSFGSVRMAGDDSAWAGWVDVGDFVALTFTGRDGYAGAADPRDTASKIIKRVLPDEAASAPPTGRGISTETQNAPLMGRGITNTPATDIAFVRWTGDRSNYRRIMPNVALKEFVVCNVKTPVVDDLVKELCVVHSLAEAAAQPAGSLEERSALTGTEGAPALGVAFSPTATHNNNMLSVSSASRSYIDVMMVPADQRTPEMSAYLADEARKRRDEALKRRDEQDVQGKRNRVEMLGLASQLLADVDDPSAAAWLQREKKNVAMIIAQPPRESPPSPKATLALTDKTDSSSPSHRKSPTLPDNPFVWTVVSRADHLRRRPLRKDECELGKHVSSAFLAKYDRRPTKVPQEDATGIARLTNKYTEQECREVVDKAIKTFKPRAA